MDISTALAKIFGIYLFVITLAMLFNPRAFKLLISEFVSNSAVLSLGGFIALILGTILIVIHNVWVMDWRVSLTLISWLIFFKGCIRLLVPQMLPRIATYFQQPSFYFSTTAFYIILAVFFIYHGFA